MERIKLSDQLELSRIVQGLSRLADWKFSDSELLRFVENALELGVTTFDNADIYGNYSTEEIFGRIFKLKPSLRNQLELVTKCGIKLLSPKFPERRLKHYDNSAYHILDSVNTSLRSLNTDHLDLLLLHRPDPFIDPDEVSKAFEELARSGKVLYFGVSNYTTGQFEMLRKRVNQPLVTNQIELSPLHLQHFENENIYFMLKEKIHPMVWSPLGGGELFNKKNERSVLLSLKLEQIAKSLMIDDIDKVTYAWILNHPVKALPISGSGKIDRLSRAVDSLQIKLSREQWYEIYVLSTGRPLP